MDALEQQVFKPADMTRNFKAPDLESGEKVITPHPDENRTMDSTHKPNSLGVGMDTVSNNSTAKANETVDRPDSQTPMVRSEKGQ